MPNDQLQWLKINDFSPGIMQRLNRLSGDTIAFPVGSADASNTFRCIALPGGGLGPLPKRTGTYARTGGLPDTTVTIGKVYNNRFTISGAHLAARIVTSGGFTAQELHIAYEYAMNLASTTYTRRYKWERHRLWEATPTVDSCVSFTTSGDSPLTTFDARPTFFHTYRADASSQVNLGTPLVVAGWYAGAGGLTQRFWDTFPDLASLTTNSVASISSTLNPDFVTGHQGRSVGLNAVSYNHGAGSTQWSANEQVYYTAVNLASLAHSSAAVWGLEDVQNYGLLASMNASELLVVKIGYGGMVIRGDLDNPTVLNVPGIPGTGVGKQVPAISAVGLVYGSLNGGVWGWGGGDSADLLSPQLENNFWQTDAADLNGFRGKFAAWKNWIVAPGNWLYDWQVKSWWLLDDPSSVKILNWLPNSDSHIMYGTPSSIAADADPSLYYWDASVPATSYQWESQVLPLGDYKTAQPRELILLAQGVGTVACTITGYTALGTSVTETHTFTLASTSRPEYQRATLGSFHAITNARLKMVSTATSAQTPVIYEAQIGFRSDPHLATI